MGLPLGLLSRACRRKTTILIPQRRYTVLSFGDGSQGALGQSHGVLSDAYEPGKVEGLPDNVIKVAAGHYHSFAITSCGQLWAWGRNNEGQLGRTRDQTREEWSQPQRVEGLEGVKVKDATGSGVASVAIDFHGSVWAWGKSKRGQLGLGEGVIEAKSPQLVPGLAGKKISKISLGWGHALACSEDGSVYSWGYPANERLGYTVGGSAPTKTKDVEELIKAEFDMVYQWQPRIVDLNGLRSVEVVCGFDHSIMLCDNGALYSFGDNSYGQLGRNEGKSFSINEARVCLNEHVIFVNAGLGHSLALAVGCSKDVSSTPDSPRAYSWGWNLASQLGRTTAFDMPMEIPGLAEYNIASLDGGRAHSVAVDRQGKLLTWGSGKNGRLGHGDFSDESEPCIVECIEACKVRQAACGMDHTIVLVNVDIN